MGFAEQIDDASKNRDFIFLKDASSRELQQWVQEAIGWRQPDGTPIRDSPTNETRRRLDDVAPLPDDQQEQTQKRPRTRLILALVTTVICIGGSLWIGAQGPRYDNAPVLERVFSRDAAYSAGSLDQPMKASNAASEIKGSMQTPQSRGNVTTGAQTPSDARQAMRTVRDGSRDQTDPQPARPQSPRAMSSEEEAKLVARAEFLIKQFDFASARLLLAYALEKGSARAAFMMAETYDWQILRSLQAYGVRGDDQRAREFYQLAAEAGLEKARERVEAGQWDPNFDARVGGEDRSR
jgi:hypothetical protein